MAGMGLGIVLLSGTHERAHFALSLAAAAAAMDRSVVLFASGPGLRVLLDDWSGVVDVGRDAVVRRAGGHGLGEMRRVAHETGVRLLACDASMHVEGIDKPLWHAVERSGLTTFLEASSAAQLVSV